MELLCRGSQSWGAGEVGELSELRPSPHHRQCMLGGVPWGFQGTQFDHCRSWERRRGVQTNRCCSFPKAALCSREMHGKLAAYSLHTRCALDPNRPWASLLSSARSHLGQRDSGHTRWEGILAAGALSQVAHSLAKRQLPVPRHVQGEDEGAR